MAGRMLATAVAAALLLLLPACSSDTDDPSREGKAAARSCEVTLDLEELGRSALRPIDGGSTVLDRDLRATRSPEGYLCLDIVIDHADYGSEAVSYRIEARQGEHEWREDGEEPDGRPPMRVEATGCVTATAALTALGAGERTYRYRARLRVDCDRGRSAP